MHNKFIWKAYDKTHQRTRNNYSLLLMKCIIYYIQYLWKCTLKINKLLSMQMFITSNGIRVKSDKSIILFIKPFNLFCRKILNINNVSIQWL